MAGGYPASLSRGISRFAVGNGLGIGRRRLKGVVR